MHGIILALALTFPEAVELAVSTQQFATYSPAGVTYHLCSGDETALAARLRGRETLIPAARELRPLAGDIYTALEACRRGFEACADCRMEFSEWMAGCGAAHLDHLAPQIADALLRAGVEPKWSWWMPLGGTEGPLPLPTRCTGFRCCGSECGSCDTNRCDCGPCDAGRKCSCQTPVVDGTGTPVSCEPPALSCNVDAPAMLWDGGGKVEPVGR